MAWLELRYAIDYVVKTMMLVMLNFFRWRGSCVMP